MLVRGSTPLRMPDGENRGGPWVRRLPVARASRSDCSDNPGDPQQAESGQGQAETVLVLVQEVMHLPETPMCTGTLRTFSRGLRVWMDLGQGEMAEHKPQLAWRNLPSAPA